VNGRGTVRKEFVRKRNVRGKCIGAHGKKWGKIAVLGPYNKNMDPGALPKGALFYSPVDFTDASDLNTLMQV